MKYIISAVLLMIFTISPGYAESLTANQRQEIANKAFTYAKEHYPKIKPVELIFLDNIHGTGYNNGIIYMNTGTLLEDVLPVYSTWIAFTMRNLELPELDADRIRFALFHEVGHAVADLPGVRDDLDYMNRVSKVKTFLEYRNVKEERDADDFAIALLKRYQAEHAVEVSA